MLVNLNWKPYLATVLAAISAVLATTDWNTFLANPKTAAVSLGAVLLTSLITLAKKDAVEILTGQVEKK